MAWYDLRDDTFIRKNKIMANFETLTAAQPRIDVKLSGTQAIANNTSTAIAFNSETYDPNGDYTTDTWTCPEDGVYLITSNLWFANNATGFREIGVYLDAALQEMVRIEASAAYDYNQIVSILDLSATNTIQIKARQTSGGDLNVGVSSTLKIVKLSS